MSDLYSTRTITFSGASKNSGASNVYTRERQVDASQVTCQTFPDILVAANTGVSFYPPNPRNNFSVITGRSTNEGKKLRAPIIFCKYYELVVQGANSTIYLEITVKARSQTKAGRLPG